MAEYKYKPGEAVRVRHDLNIKYRYYMRSGRYPNQSNNYVNDKMCAFAGQIVHINRNWGSQYEIQEDGHSFCWTDEMFEDPNCLFHPVMV